MVLGEILPQQSFAFMVIFARVGTLIMLMPGFDQVFVPVRVRAAFAVLVSLVMVPVVTVPTISDNGLETFIIVAQEVLVGAFLGLMAKFVLSALDTAGTIIGMQTGIANAFILNPGMAQQGAIFGVFLVMAGMVAIFATDLHHHTFFALASSYDVFPPGTWLPLGDAIDHLGRIFSKSFGIAVQLAAPLIVLGIIFNVGVGILSRLMPQVQIFFITVSGQIIMGLFVLAMTTAALMMVFLKVYQDTFVGVL